MRARSNWMPLAVAGLAAVSACGGSNSDTEAVTAGAGGSAGAVPMGEDGGRVSAGASGRGAEAGSAVGGASTGDGGRPARGGTSGSAGRAERGGASGSGGENVAGGGESMGSAGRAEGGGASGSGGESAAGGESDPSAGSSGAGGAAGGGGESVPDGGTAGAGNDSCLAMLPRRASGVAPCPESQLQCVQIEEQPNREVSWYFSLDESVAGAELESQTDCLVAYAEARGAVVTYRGSLVAQLDFDGTYAQLSPLLDLALVAEWGVSCDEVDCEYCKSLSLDACEQDAFCWTVLAGRLDPTLGCVWRDEPAGCHISGTMCELVVTHALSPSGDCWEFNDDCLPDGFVDHTLQTPAQGVDCSEVFADEPPACE